MDTDELNDKLRAITDRFYKPPPMGLLGQFGAPFDASKPNIHDNKQDFLAEQGAVLASMAHIEGMIDLLAENHRKRSVTEEAGERLTAFIDEFARLKSKSLKTEYGYDLVRRNAAEVGLSICLAFQMIDIHDALTARKQELSDQGALYWSGNSRPPNHYARTIALRFARFIATYTHAKPTFGTSRDGGHPSTDFGRA